MAELKKTKSTYYLAGNHLSCHLPEITQEPKKTVYSDRMVIFYCGKVVLEISMFSHFTVRFDQYILIAK